MTMDSFNINSNTKGNLKHTTFKMEEKVKYLSNLFARIINILQNQEEII